MHFLSVARGGLLALVVMGFSGCMRDESVLSINKDGSGTIEETLLVSGAAKESMEGMMNQVGDVLAKGFGVTNASTGTVAVTEAKTEKKGLFDKASFEKRAKELGPGVTLTGYEEKKDGDGFTGVKVTYAVKDVRTLKYTSDKDLGDKAAGMTGEAEGGEKKAKVEPLTFDLTGDTLTIHHPKPAAKKPSTPEEIEAAKQAEAMAGAMGQMMAGMFRDAQVRLIVRLPGGIASTDASFVKENDITLAAVDMNELTKDPQGLKQLTKLSENAATPDELKGIKGVTMEPKDTVTVKLK